MGSVIVPEQDLVQLIEAFNGVDRDEFEYWVREFSQPAIDKWFWNHGYVIFEREFVSYMIDKFYEWRRWNHNI